MNNFDTNILKKIVEMVTGSDSTILESSELKQEDNIVEIYGCDHYMRRCKIVSPCCNKVYSCRLCHDENENHKINRYDIHSIICAYCDFNQTPKQYCENCSKCMGLYFCSICNLFDDVDKKQYHCVKCGLCRIGSDINYHCDKCNICLNKKLQDNHVCIDQIGNTCPICLENLHDSVNPVSILKCSHHIHTSCLGEYLETNYKCPICCQSMTNMKNYNNLLDFEVENTPMPEEYRDIVQNILCNDCLKESQCKFHIIGMKCSVCGSYNTRNI